MLNLPEGYILSPNYEQFTLEGKFVTSKVQSTLAKNKLKFQFYTMNGKNSSLTGQLKEAFFTGKKTVTLLDSDEVLLFKVIENIIDDKDPAGWIYIEMIGNDVYYLNMKQDKVISENVFNGNSAGIYEATILEIKSLINVACNSPELAPTLYVGCDASEVLEAALPNLEGDTRNRVVDAVERIEKSRALLQKSDNGILIGRDEHGVSEADYPMVEDRPSILAPLIVEDNPALSRPLNKISNSLRKRDTERLIAGGVFFALFALVFTHDGGDSIKKINESIATTVKNVKMKDDYAEYREIITRTGISSELMLYQTSSVLSKLEKDMLYIGWGVSNIGVKDNTLNFTMASTSGTNKDLRDYARINKMIVYTNQEQIHIAGGVERFAINDEVYLTPIDSEFNYLNDAYKWLYDQGNVVIEKRETKENWSKIIAAVNFECWTSDDFGYFSSQLYNRNYAFISLDAQKTLVEGIKGDDSEDGNKVDMCGYTGKIVLEILGYNGFAQGA